MNKREAAKKMIYHVAGMFSNREEISDNDIKEMKIGLEKFKKAVLTFSKSYELALNIPCLRATRLSLDVTDKYLGHIRMIIKKLDEDLENISLEIKQRSKKRATVQK